MAATRGDRMTTTGPRRRLGVAATALAGVVALAGSLLTATTVSAAPVTATTSASAATAPTAPTAAAAVTSDAGGIAPGTRTPTLSWGPCGAGLEAFRCTTAQVPTDYDRPRGATTTLALIKLPASGPGARIGSLFTNPGGPGGSGVDFVTAAPQLYTAALRARYDIIGFDPRGVVRSDPATCFATAQQEASSPLLRLAYPLTRPQGRTFVREAVAFARQCTSTSPDRFRHASTANVARDLELLRRAVGDEKLTYAGYSYGTYLGATYARLFPDRVGRFVLDGTVDPKAWSGTGRGDAAQWVPFGIRTRQGVGAWETFREFAKQCKANGPAQCSLAALGDPLTVATRTFDRLAASPVTVETPSGPLVIDQQIAVLLSFQALYDPASWRDLADTLAALSVSSPSPDRVAAAVAGTTTTVGERVRGEAADERGEDYASAGGNLASVCVDTRRSGLLGSYPAIADAYDSTAPYFGRFRLWTGAICERWGLTDTDAFLGPWAQTTTAKVLVIGTRFDPATPYSQTRPYAGLWPDADVLTVQGYGHTALGKSTCADAAVTRYLLTGRTGGADRTCRQDLAPFAAPADGARTAPHEPVRVSPRWLGL